MDDNALPVKLRKTAMEHGIADEEAVKLRD